MIVRVKDNPLTFKDFEALPANESSEKARLSFRWKNLLEKELAALDVSRGKEQQVRHCWHGYQRVGGIYANKEEKNFLATYVFRVLVRVSYGIPNNTFALRNSVLVWNLSDMER